MRSNINNQLKIYYKIKNTTIKELSLDINNATFGDIIKYYNNNIKPIYPHIKLKSKYFFNGKELDQSNIILHLFMNQNIKIEKIKQVHLEIFLDEIYNLYDEYSPNYSKIIIPNKTKNLFEIYIYYPNKGIIDIEEYNENIFNEYYLYKINFKTASCNSINYLFLSGGEYNNEIINDFWMIDNSTYSINCMKLPSPKCEHTMFPINSNSILIIGGNDDKTYLFNIYKNEFSKYENTNKIHTHPSLFLWKNYIYCFSEQNKSIIAERILFLKVRQKWENISLNYNDNELLFNINNIGVDAINNEYENKLIILGGGNNLIYNPLNNNIKKIKNDYFNSDYDFDICLGDKNFYKISKYYDICIPEDFMNEKKIIVFNKRFRYFHKMSFNNTVQKIKIQYEENEKITDENNIIIKVELYNSLEKTKNKSVGGENINYNDNIEIINTDENNNNNEVNVIKLIKRKTKIIKSVKEDNVSKDKDKDSNIESEKEIIFNEDFTFKGSNDNVEDYKSHPSKTNLIIPNNVIYENFIKRISESNENKIDDIYDIKENETKFIPKKHSLFSDLVNIDDNNKKQNIIFDNEIIIENNNVNVNENEINKEQIIKPKITFHLSSDSLDGQLINREIINERYKENDELNNINKNEENKVNNGSKGSGNIINIINSNNINNSNNNNNEGNLDDVFSFDAFEYNGEDNKNENENEDEMKNNNIFTSKEKLFISQDSMKDEIKDKKIELEPKDNEKDKINNENK